LANSNTFPRAGLIRGWDDAVVHRLDPVFGQLGLKLGHDLVEFRGVVIHGEFRILLAQLLARIETRSLFRRSGAHFSMASKAVKSLKVYAWQPMANPPVLNSSGIFAGPGCSR